MILTKDNYFSTEASKAFWSVSSFKAFDHCEASGLAMVEGRYQREKSDALLVGGYVDAYFTDDLNEYCERNNVYKKNGEKYAKYSDSDRAINAVECQPLMMDYLDGDHQVIMTAPLFGVDWKIKMDAYREGERIVDLKYVKDFKPIYKDGFGMMDWISYWGYDIQGAVYQSVVEAVTGKNLPFYIVAVTKEKTPDIAVYELPQPYLDTALKVVEAKIDRFDLVKMGEIEPNRCEVCDYCKMTKVLTVPSVYETEV